MSWPSPLSGIMWHLVALRCISPTSRTPSSLDYLFAAWGTRPPGRVTGPVTGRVRRWWEPGMVVMSSARVFFCLMIWYHSKRSVPHRNSLSQFDRMAISNSTHVDTLRDSKFWAPHCARGSLFAGSQPFKHRATVEILDVWCERHMFLRITWKIPQ